MEIIGLSDAKSAGLKRYFTGQSCANGHSCGRFVSNGQCVECLYERKARWRASHLSEIRPRDRVSKNAWAAKNREKVRALAKAWNAANPEGQAKRSRAWFLANKDKANASTEAWRERNKGKAAARQGQRRAAKMQRTPVWADREAMQKVYDLAAQMRELGIPVEVDHAIPLQGETVSGLHVPWNIQIMEMSQNRSKANFLQEH